MAMAMMKTEEHLGRRRPCMEDCETSERRHVKRRRRDTVASSLGITKQEAELTAAQTTVKRSSRFRGVSRHRWTGRYEAHLWDKLSWNVTQKKKGKQVYLGAYDDEEAAARAYDLAALKYWGTSTFVNFPLSDYEEDIEIMQNLTKEEYLASLRRKSSGFSRGVSKYRGVARHHHNGRWEARIGRVFGNKYLYLGTYSTQEEAAHAYDIAAIEYRGVNAVTNFDLSTYFTWLKPAANNSAPAKVTEPSMQSQEEPSTFSLGKKLQVSCLETNASRANDLNKQEMHGRKVLLNSYRRSSSPTALSLLLRSSVFRELVEKNSNLLEEEIDENRTKNPQQQMSIDEYQFCDLPLLLSTGPGIELQEQLRFNYDYLDSFGSSATNMVSLC